MRILIFSVGEKMNLNQKTPRVDKRRSGLEGGSGYIISTDQEQRTRIEGGLWKGILLFQSGTRKHNEAARASGQPQAPTAWDKLRQSRPLRVRESLSHG